MAARQVALFVVAVPTRQTVDLGERALVKSVVILRVALDRRVPPVVRFDVQLAADVRYQPMS